ncbi:MAG: amidase [Bacteroidia bacterium]|nr:amidase [Bacteroidia bacterium]
MLRTLMLLLAGLLSGAFLTLTLIRKPLTAAMVAQAEQIIGLEFTPAERDSMLPLLEQNRAAFDSLRKQSFPNSLLPALVFDPLPPGVSLPAGEDRFSPLPPPPAVLPADREALAFYSVRQLSELIRSRQITSVELTRFFLDRIKRYDPVLHCAITLMEAPALEQAARMDRELQSGLYRGPLHGIPYGAKDLLFTRQAPTSFGAAPYRGQQAEEDAAVIRKLDAAGAVLVAKLSLGELAMDDVWFGGRTRNPWNPETGSSGSSAGSASAVAAGLVPFAIGSETWGSIVSPATVCGVTGLRPSFGMVSRQGAMALSWSMDKLGPMARTAEDCAFVFEAIRGRDPHDPSTVQVPFRYHPAGLPRKLRIGYLRDDFGKTYRGKAQDEAALAQLRAMGHELVPVAFSEFPDISFLLMAEAAAAFDELTRSNRDDLLAQQGRYNWPNFYRSARLIPAVEYIQANRHRSRLIAEAHRVLQTVDLIVAPSLEGNSLLLTNLTGHPSVTLPNGFDPKDRLPTSITFIGRLYEDGPLLALAQQYQQATRFHLEHPVLPR